MTWIAHRQPKAEELDGYEHVPPLGEGDSNQRNLKL